MNILLFFSAPIIPTQGGVQRVCTLLTKIFESRGHKVWYLCGPFDKNQKNICESIDKEHQLILPDGTNRQLATQTNFKYIDKILKEKKIDIIYNQNGPFYWKLFKYLKNAHPEIPRIWCVHSMTPSDDIYFETIKSLCKRAHINFLAPIIEFSPIKKLALSLYKYCAIDWRSRQSAKSVDAILLLSETLEPDFLSHFNNKKPNTPIYAVPNAYSFEPLEKINFNEKEKTLLFVGRLDPNSKRPDLLLKIWSKLQDRFPEWNVKIVGDGDAKNQCLNLIKELKLKRVSMEGFQNPKPYYEKASIFCMTSVICEAFGMVLVEAAAYGCVPVAFNSYPSVTDIITNGVNGELVETFNIDAYANKLASLMSDNKKQEQLATQAWLDVNHFSPETIYNKWMSVFEKIGIKQ